MGSLARQRCVRHLVSFSEASQSTATTLPSFLVPAFARGRQQSSSFSTTRQRQSKIGSAALSVPPEVSFQIVQAMPAKQGARVSETQVGSIVHVEGPLGKLSLPIPSYMSIKSNEATRSHTLSILDQGDRKQREMWGTTRAYLQNYILGVSEGHTAILRLVGVGYRATVEKTAVTKSPGYEGQQFVSLKVGYSHPIELGIPQGVKASTPQPTRILLEGRDKEVVKQFAAEIREWRKPEPYKGKGIFVNGETIKLKAKKIK